MTHRTFLTLALLAAVTGCERNRDVPTPAVADSAKLQEAKAEPIMNEPMHANTFYAGGRLAESQNQPDRAIQIYQRALQTDPRHAPSLYRLGILFSQQKRYPEAVDAWKRYIKATDNSAVGYSNLAFCYEEAGKLDDAEKTYKKGISRDPKSQSCHTNYGLLLAHQNRPDEAIAQFSTVLSPAESHYNLASVYEQQGKNELARAEYEKALQADPKFHDAQQRLATLK